MNGDLISRYALRKSVTDELERLSCVLYKYNEYYSATQKAFNTVLDFIDNAPTVELDEMTQDLIDKVNVNIGLAQPIKVERPQGEWIPVSERLPEALQSVLVTSKGGYVYTSYIVHGEWEYGGEVIAWQPLPEPYKKGGAQ